MLRITLVLCLGLLLSMTRLVGATLTLKGESKTITLRTADLLKHPKAEDLEIPLLNYPNVNMKVRGIPIEVFLKALALKDGDWLRFNCLDGFSGLIDPLRFRGTAKAFVAIEPKNKKWPPLPKENNKSKGTAGPFYLVWQNGSIDNIPPEYWPYQLSSFEIVSSFERSFPKLMPGPKIERHSSIYKGFQVYKERCMQCHFLNGQGTASMGPDLNIPMNPVEYFQRDALKKFIKDPASVRSWAEMKMKWVDGVTWKEQEVLQLIDYLEHKAKTRE